jgi:type I restriction enzyme S subunit
MKMKNNKMKEDWVECCFDDLLDYVQPTKYIVKSTQYSNSYKTPVLTAGKSFIKGYTNETDGVFENLPTIIFDDFTTATQFVNFKFKVKSSAMKILVPTSKLVNMTFVYYCMQVNQVRNDTHKRYWISVFAKKKFLLPSLVEQKAIVAKIESLFSSLDSGIADLKKAQAQLIVYRQAVLKKAFEGELTKKSIKPEIIKLGSVIDKPRYGTSKKCSLDPKGIAVLRIPNIGFGKVNTDELKYASFDKNEILTLALREGDILTIRSNGSVDLVGKCALITKKDLDYLYAGYLIRLRPDLEKIDSKFLLHCLSSHNLRIQIESKAKSTSGVNNINSGELESLEIPLFPIQEQHQIVKEIESRLSVCDKVEESIKESLLKAEALRQSILKKAFDGKLLSEVEIAQCKLQADYEPAHELLEKIKSTKK